MKEFSKEALSQAVAASKIKTSSFLSQREDLRGKTVFAFSESSSQNAEQAFSLYKNGNGWRLGVHIADVAEYVCECSPLDSEARSRCARIFNGLTVQEMLPENIVFELCDLTKKGNKLTLSVFLDIDANGTLTSIEFCESVINVVNCCYYDEVDQILGLAADASSILALREKYASIINILTDLYELAAMFRSKREAKKGFDCASIRRVYERNQEGKITSFSRVVEADSQAMVREIGYFVAVSVGEYMAKKKLPCVYNGRGDVDKVVLDYLAELVGVESDDSRTLLTEVAEKAKGSEYYDFVCEVLSSNTPNAVFSVEPIFNVFTASECTVSFFRPATRYTDLMLQRILKNSIAASGDPRNMNLNRHRKLVSDVAEEANKAEQVVFDSRRRILTENALEYLENTERTEFAGFPLYVAEEGYVPVILNCGLFAIVPSEYAKDFNFIPAMPSAFEIIALGTLNEHTIIKPR